MVEIDKYAKLKSHVDILAGIFLVIFFLCGIDALMHPKGSWKIHPLPVVFGGIDLFPTAFGMIWLIIRYAGPQCLLWGRQGPKMVLFVLLPWLSLFVLAKSLCR
jgi:hypothetical protein